MPSHRVPEYLPRLADARLPGLLRSFPAILIVGPRAAGKTTTAQRYASTIVHLDHDAEAAVFRFDPDAALRDLAEPILLDEWQEVPAVLGAVKRAVDADPRPGRFLLTGSVRADLGSPTWPGTGRVLRIAMWGLTVREQRADATAPSIIDRLVDEGTAALSSSAGRLDLRDYAELALSSGFPDAVLRLEGDQRALWLESYVDQLVTRDVPLIEPRRDPDRVRAYLQALAANTAGVVEDKTIYEAAGINRKTAVAYEQLLKNLLVTEWIPTWATNRLKRLARLPKRYLTDAGLLGPLLPTDVDRVMRDGDLLGRLLDTFVAAQVRAELDIAQSQGRLYHLRTKEQRQEVDLLVETATGILAFEVKATSAPSRRDARHLAWLRDELPDRFRAGILLHTGPRAFDLDERIAAAPISALWA